MFSVNPFAHSAIVLFRKILEREVFILALKFVGNLGRGQTPYFSWAESNANEKSPLFSLIKLH